MSCDEAEKYLDSANANIEFTVRQIENANANTCIIELCHILYCSVGSSECQCRQ